LRSSKRFKKVRSNYVVFDNEYDEWDPTPNWSAPEPDPKSDPYSDSDEEMVIDQGEIRDPEESDHSPTEDTEDRKVKQEVEKEVRETPVPSAPSRGVSFNPMFNNKL